MLSGRFRTLLSFLNGALRALVERGQDAGMAAVIAANAAVAAIEAARTVRQERLQWLMDRFEAGLLRTRATVGAAATRRATAGRVAARPAPLWPWHRAGWLHLVGTNHPSYAVRYRWNHSGSTLLAARIHLQDHVAALRALVEGEAAMRGLLEASGEARRLVRWLLRMGDMEALPAILAEKPRTRARRTRRVARPWVKWVPAPFEAPPDTLLREERVARLMWVPPATQLYDPGAFPITPDWVQRRR